MTITLPPLPPSQLQEDAVHAPTISSLSTLSTLWVPLDETAGQWADFGKEAITVSALLATGTAFGGLAWETRALRHYTWAVHERKRGRPRKQAHWLERAVQDLDCAIDQWQQVLSWLDLAGNADEQQDPASLEAIRNLVGQVAEHQARRRTLHRQVLQEYASVKQQAREPSTGRNRSDDHHTRPLSHHSHEAGERCHHRLPPDTGLADRDAHGQ